jgi:ribonuclease BN (tRNA processing enzyme)|tara:strand:- start:509 stop:1279 length:771 start_codon:yes stop_codon:yes gene_type:complete
VKIKFLGAHNTESTDARLSSLLIDDILVLDAGGLTSSLFFPAQLKIKAILVTHQHYDHIRDIPTIAMNFFLRHKAISIYATALVREILLIHLLNGELYPKFLEKPSEKPTIDFHEVEPYQQIQIQGYSVLAVPVTHAGLAVGYQLTSARGKSLFYTGDTGPGLDLCWQYISPQVLIIEVTVPNRYEDFARESGHLTPGLLKRELMNFQKLKGYLPQILTVHMNPALEAEIRAELTVVAKELDCLIKLAYEGMQLKL